MFFMEEGDPSKQKCLWTHTRHSEALCCLWNRMGSLSNLGVQVTGQVGSHKVHSSVSPYQFKVISELFTLCLLFILNLGREEKKCCLLDSLQTPI